MIGDHASAPLSFADVLREHRLAAGLTQEELAERAGLSARGVSDLERGARGHPYRETVRLLADALGLRGAERDGFVRAAPRALGRAAKLPERAPRLPVPLTPLIGRHEERARISGMLTSDATRLVTLTGPGGVGKSRLALAVAEQVGDAFPAGVVFVDLAPLGDPTLVRAQVAATLGLRETAGRTLTEVLDDALRERAMLLLLDNYEHLLDAAPVVADLLAAGPRVKVLVTSRAPLRVRGEREYAVPPLRLPTPEDARDLSALVTNEAVAVFVERAQAARQDFALTAENAQTIADICLRLDGLPLALELAAARTKILPPASLLARLDTRLPLLIGGSRDAPERQRTLRDAIAWSHDLLAPDEQALFRRLGVFAGGWTLPAAEAVANLEGELDVLEVLSSLADKSLIQLDDRGPAPRYRMLETIREFALDNLRQHSEEEETVLSAHAVFFADMGLARWPEIGSGAPEAISRVEAEEDNLRSMLVRLLDEGDAETALHVAGRSLSVYWTVAGGQFTEARAWLDRALRLGTAASPAARGWGLAGLTNVALFQGDFVTARMAAIECHALAHVTDDLVLMAQASHLLSVVEEAEGRIDAAAERAVEAVEAARAADDRCILGWALKALGTARWRAGDFAGATSALEESLALFQELNGVWGESNALMNLAGVARSRGNHERAARFHADSLRLRLDTGVLADAFDDLVGIAEIAYAKGHLELAARLLGAEDAYREIFGSVGWGITPLLREQMRQALDEQLGDVRFARAWEAGRALSTEQVITEALALADNLSAPMAT